MRKLLLLLCTGGSFSVAFANYLPSGNYSGYLKSAKGTIDNADANKTSIINDQVNVSIPKLSDIGATDGVLTGQIINMGQGGADCIANPQFSAKKFGVPVSASNVHITQCAFNPTSNTFTGSYSATVIIFGVQSGIFSFSLR